LYRLGGLSGFGDFLLNPPPSSGKVLPDRAGTDLLDPRHGPGVRCKTATGRRAAFSSDGASPAAGYQNGTALS
jgi:hypothetical protein